ncbi:HpcH/HpaI aldolase/citrate lyase family protein [Plantibacter sp. YIM 135249]|jgi:citrate lyase subunit beta/citryl-CoA lyase|uniref:HpcH/HpaI aldolase/citrate lyase family protein n=1 Tax=Plantibacter sp. YIM 135249 TaxID=3423918 RepID=UPI003D338CF7
MNAAAFTLGPSLLFCPADRPDRFRKAADRADAVILDLEDAVGSDDKDAARRAIVEEPLDPERTIVRVNAAGTDAFALDLRALAATEYRTVMLAKAEHPSQLEALAEALPGVRVLALCETAVGVYGAGALAAHPATVGLMWGAEDLVASLGGTSSRTQEGAYRGIAVHARASVLLAAGAHGIAAIDAVHVDLDDADGLAIEAGDAAASGFSATACLHPAQVPIIREAYRPTETELADAVELLEIAAHRPGVFRHRGRMVDEPVLLHARRVVDRAGR